MYCHRAASILSLRQAAAHEEERWNVQTSLLAESADIIDDDVSKARQNFPLRVQTALTVRCPNAHSMRTRLRRRASISDIDMTLLQPSNVAVFRPSRRRRGGHVAE